MKEIHTHMLLLVAILEKEETSMKEFLVFHLKTLLEQCTGNH